MNDSNKKLTQSVNLGILGHIPVLINGKIEKIF